jgi:hypothetical protein
MADTSDAVWQPKISPVGKPDGYCAMGMMGRTFVVKDQKWILPPPKEKK